MSRYVPAPIAGEESRRLRESLNRRLYTFDKYVSRCPNDGSKLEIVSPLAAIGTNPTTYQEGTMCPKCSCSVFRRPDYKRIRAFEKRSKLARIDAASGLELALSASF